MIRRTTVLCVVGTRPEAIKMAPVIALLRKRHQEFEGIVCSTGQHAGMLDDVMSFFGIIPDVSLSVLRHGQSLASLTSLAVAELDRVVAELLPDWILVQGDTTTAWAAAYCGYLHRRKIGHVEAGLRTQNKYSPFPEEMNRRLIGVLADIHFAPTSRSASALRREGVPDERIVITGNTIVDALSSATSGLACGLDATPFADWLPRDAPMLLVTAHRRENFESGLKNICSSLLKFCGQHHEYRVVFQVHPNPIVTGAITSLLAGQPNILLVEPQPYGSFLNLMRRSRFILTDSGGIQEEAPSFNKPVLVARNNTERPEGIEQGCAELVGTTEGSILNGLLSLATDESKYNRMSSVTNPYGDGAAAARIIDFMAGK